MELETLRFDSYKTVTLLKEQGFTKKQSEGIMEVIQDLENKITKILSDNLKFQIIQSIVIIGVMVALFQIL